MHVKKEITELDNAVSLLGKGFNPSFIELSEKAAFPHIIPAAPATARKSRVTGVLLGRPAPEFVRHGRSIRYRLSALLEWLENGQEFTSTAQAFLHYMGKAESSATPFSSVDEELSDI